MFRPKDTQDRILHRLQIASGHLKKVIAMVQSDSYCIDVVHQSQAVQKALGEIDNLVMENHLKTCVAADIKRGDGEQAISEVMTVFKKRD